MNLPKKTGLALALAAAGMVGTSATLISTNAVAAGSDVHCYGVNKCKGHNDCKVAGHKCQGYNDCKTAKNDCKGQAKCATAGNKCAGHASCKGTGFVSMSAKACEDIGGVAGK